MVFAGMRSRVASRSRAERMSAGLLYALTVVLALTLPFEVVRPVLSLRWLVFTNLELLIVITAIALAAHLLLHVVGGRLPEAAARHWRRHAQLICPALLFVSLAAVSALVAPAYQFEALKFVSRFASGLFVFFLTMHVASTRSRLGGLIWAIVLGAGLSALVGLGQAAGWRVLDPLLGLFAKAPTRAGGELRVNGTFVYATIASMFFEMAIPLALAAAAAARMRIARFVAVVIAVTSTAVVVLTLTRTGMITVAVVLVLMLWLAHFRRRWGSLGLPSAVAALTLVAVIGALVVRNPTFYTRLTTENDQNWYGARYVAPASLTVTPGDPATTAVAARNAGQATWKATGEHYFALGYRWLSDDGLWALSLPFAEVALPHDVAPGEEIRLTVQVQAPVPPGDYRLAWGMLQRDILWFRHRGVPEVETAVHVLSGRPATATMSPPSATEPRDDLPLLPPIMPRAALWGAVLRMMAERPLLGVGPDNVRRLYGQYLDLTVWDQTNHANNLYLEMLADLGLLGAAPFGYLVLMVILELAGVLRAQPTQPQALWAVGLGGSLVAFLLHGLLDYFLEFVSVYLLFWITLGLIVALARGTVMLHRSPEPTPSGAGTTLEPTPESTARAEQLP